MKELKLEELSARQKLGMTFTAFLNGDERTPEEDAFIVDLIKNHSLGSVWIQATGVWVEELMEMINDAADYPILIFTDAESGIPPYLVGKHNAIAATGNEKHAYIFGKVVGVTARKMGYNVVCDPVVDMRAGSQRSLGTDKERVSKLAEAMARGMHDAGVLNVAKHFPGGSNPTGVDSHMGEAVSPDTKEELLQYSMCPYKHLIDEGLLDGIMTSHKKMINIDPERPTSLSKPVIDIIRELGFDGFAITDALCMMGIRAKFGDVDAKGFALEAGNDTILPYASNSKKLFEEYCEAYDKGLISDERLDEAARRILDAQHKAMMLPKDAELTDEEIEMFYSINKDGVYAKTDAGVTPNISRDGKHFFVVMTKCEFGIEKAGKVDVDTFSGGWHNPFTIKDRLLELFPNSEVRFINEFPTQSQNYEIMRDAFGYDELVFITFSESLAFVGEEQLTYRLVRLVEAMQLTDRISTIVHFGNPFVLEVLPHFSRVILGGNSAGSVDACIDVLAGEYPANGVPTYDFKLK
ncbi:MAG: hypothetical protein IJC09_04180 [Clostridia bacterium]|nr:hypothetical protein [Clostridia bacterium]